jgi:N-carbamoyl-L-amino-acid hydrolase
VTQDDLRVNADRLNRRIAELAEFGKLPEGGVNRVAFGEADIEARRYAMSLMQHAGLVVRVDPVGNIVGRREGSMKDAGTIMFGSHIDTVPRGGAYDGALGSLAAIEVAHTLKHNGYRNRHALEAVIWCDEESGLTGSRGFVGELSQDDMNQADKDGTTLAEKVRKVGGEPSRIREAIPEAGRIAAYLELHVEQGSVLEQAGNDVGVVEGFVGIQRYDVVISGVPNHAGTTPMDRRRNALLTAAELVLAVDRIVKAVPGRQVGTVGRLTVSPGAPNVIPGRVDLTVELRDLSIANLAPIWQDICSELRELADRHHTTVSHELHQSTQPTMTDAGIRDVIVDAARDLGLSSTSMPSGAGHDAQKLAQICPTGMIFVPSQNGVSHSADEFTRPQDVANGANVLLQSILRVDEL